MNVRTQSFAREFRLTRTGIQEHGELAAGDAIFDLYEGKIAWFGKERDIVIHVPARESARRHERDDDPKVIIGTALLRYTHLAVAFFEQDRFGSVRIHEDPACSHE
jgi:hypothetical protein